MTPKSIPERDTIAPQDQWDLTPLFPSDGAWEEAYCALEAKMKLYESHSGDLSLSAQALAEAIRFDLEVSRELDRIFTYAHLKNDEDKANQNNSGLFQKAMGLYTRISEASSFLAPEIQAIPDETMRAFLTEPILADYRFHLEKIVRQKPHTLGVEAEKVLAMTMDMAHAPSAIFSELDNADLSFGMVTDESGNEIELSHGNFITFLMNPVREIRKEAFFKYYKAYEDHKHTIAQALAASIKKDRFFAQARKHASCREASLFSDNVPEAVYDSLIQAVRKNLPPLFTYLDFRKKVLGVDELRMYDTYAPLSGDVTFNMSYEEAVDTCAAALSPLGSDYTETMKQGLLSGWVDRYENKGKKSGAYSSGCYDSPPYILMNYDPKNINSLYTLMHEAGHSMHSHYAKSAQPYHYHNYTIFVAEVASTLNETLLSHYLLDLYKNNIEMQSYILNREIDNIRATLFRQTMFAEFEKIIHGLAEENKPLTLSVLTGEYRKLLGLYFGDAMAIDEPLALECLRIPHFYSAFYVYKYATGISAAISLANRIIHIGDAAAAQYLEFLKLGGRMFPIDELIQAGVDMTGPEPVETAITHFKGLVERFMDIHGKS